jgi:hypothetical protein
MSRDDRLGDGWLGDDMLRGSGLEVCKRGLGGDVLWESRRGLDDEMRGDVRGDNRSISSFMLSVRIKTTMSANVVQ